jgi:hypothetical protein
LIVFIAGAFAAWWLLEPSWHPENYREMAYQRTHLPLVATYAGGLVAVAAVAIRRAAADRA